MSSPNREQEALATDSTTTSGTSRGIPLQRRAVSAERAELCVVVMKQLQSPPSTVPQVMLSLAHSFSATVQTPWWSAWRQVPYRSRFRRLQRPEQHSPHHGRCPTSKSHGGWQSRVGC